MARTFGKFACSMWQTGSEYRSLPRDAQWLYELLFSQASITPAGCLPLQPTKWANCASDTTVGDVRNALAMLVDRRYVLVDEDTEELMVRTFINHDGAVNNPKLVKAIEAAVPRIESARLRAAAADQLAKALVERQSIGIANGDGILPSSHKPAAISLKPETAQPAQARPVDNHRPDQDPAAAASIMEQLIAHRLTMPGIRNPGGFERKVRNDAAIAFQEGRHIRQIAITVIGLTADATDRILGNEPPPPSADPDCVDCAGSGWRTVEEGSTRVEPCPCTASNVTPLRRTS